MALYAIEADIRGKPPDERRQVRQARARPRLDAVEVWLRTTMETLSRKSDTTTAILYALNRWEAFTRYVDDGCSRRLNFDPPCRLNFDPGPVAAC